MSKTRKFSTRVLGMTAVAGALVAVPFGLSTATASAASGNWDAVAQCESSGNWSTNTGNGFYGGLQFDYGTWLSNGGGKYAKRADLATKTQQIAIASIVQRNRGWSPWPYCREKLGLP